MALQRDKRSEPGRHHIHEMAATLPFVAPNMSAEAHASTGDASIVARAQRGDVDAFEILYKTHAGRVYALCLRLTGNGTRARELTQDVFVRAWEALPEFRGDASLTTWLHRIAVNAMLMQQRSDKRRSARVALADDDGDDSDAALQGATAPTDVAAAIDLERAISALPPGVRRAFVLHDVEGYSHEEIARMTGLAAGTLRAQLHRARQLLMRALSL
jgi:RNA polymerase sigma-70 factor (ECF subfamily)